MDNNVVETYCTQIILFKKISLEYNLIIHSFIIITFCSCETCVILPRSKAVYAQNLTEVDPIMEIISFSL